MPRSLRSVGGAIRELREEAGLSISALARIAKLDTATLTRIEAEDRTHVRFSTVCLLASALGVSTDEIGIRAGLLRKKAAGPRSRPATAAALDGIEGVDNLLGRAKDRLAKLGERLRSG